MLRKGSNIGRRPKARAKITIKPFKVKPTLPPNYLEDSWAGLAKAVQSIYGKQGSGGASLEELYATVDSLCSYKHAKTLEGKLRTLLGEIASGMGTELSGRAKGLEGSRLLSAMDEVYADACEHLLLVRQIFLVLDRSYIIVQPGGNSLWNIGLTLFRTHVLEAHPGLLSSVTGALVEAVTGARSGAAVDSEVIVRLVQMLGSLQLYEAHFLGPFLAASDDFYAAEGGVKLVELGLPGYVGHVQARYAEETERIVSFRAVGSTQDALMKILDTHLVQANVSQMLDSGAVAALLDGPLMDPLGMLYALMVRVKANAALRAAFTKYLVDAGSAVVLDETKDKAMVGALIELHKRGLDVLSGPFRRDSDLTYGLKDAFEKVLNARPNTPAELIAKYMDKLLKSNVGKGSDEATLLAKLDAGLALFQFVSGKDVFEAFYKKDLAKRLLLGKSSSMDAERAMIARLRDECGTTFSGKLEGMMKDIDLSRDLHNAWLDAAPIDAPGNLFVHVLTMGFWPSYGEHTVVLPDDLSAQLDAYLKFYLSKHSGRKLTWQHSLATVSLAATFESAGKKMLSVSLFQAVVMMLFNDAAELSFTDIKAATQLPDKELVRTLLSLCAGKPKTRVLRKSPKGKSVNKTDVFCVNPKFTNPLFKIKINQIQIKESKAEASATKSRVFQDRQYLIDAAIVRVMKSRKSLAHALLAAEVLKQLRFDVSNIDFKRRVESLIERRYLERHPDERGVYNYLA